MSSGTAKGEERDFLDRASLEKLVSCGPQPKTLGAAGAYVPVRERVLTYFYFRLEKIYHYIEFNGGTTNYDNHGRNASDNNVIMLYTWFSF